MLTSRLALAEPAISSFKDIEGHAVPSIPEKDKGATVLIFITTDCPVANKTAPEIQRIIKEYSTKGVAFLLVHVDPDVTDEAARKHAQDYGYHCTIVADRKHELVKLAGATVTPEAAVLSPEGKLLYRGRVNNLQEDYGKKRVQLTSNDLREALDAVLAHQPVPHPLTKSIGCYIPELKPKQ